MTTSVLLSRLALTGYSGYICKFLGWFQKMSRRCVQGKTSPCCTATGLRQESPGWNHSLSISDIAEKLKDGKEDGTSWETLNKSAWTPTPHSTQMALKCVYRRKSCELCCLTVLGITVGNQWRKPGLVYYLCRPQEVVLPSVKILCAKTLLIAKPFLCSIKFAAGLISITSEVQGRSTLQSKATNPSDSSTACETGLMIRQGIWP